MPAIPYLSASETAKEGFAMQWLVRISARLRAGAALRGGSLREVAVALGIVVACLVWRLMAGGAAADAAPKASERAAPAGTPAP
ncbi:hypothetical protein EBR56_02780, partial [bacterium]|nr:hypothetical protein [bacterium]